jgi:putative ABC transport system permease protein
MPLAVAAAVVFIAIAAAMMRRPPTTKLALRNVLRRPGQSLLIISGLLVASLVISAALVAGDATETMFLSNVYRIWGPVDLIVGTLSGRPFDQAEARRMLQDETLRSFSDGWTIRLQLLASAEAPSVGTRETQINLIGIEPEADASLGKFESPAGAELTDPGAGVFINERLAGRLGLRAGEELSFFTTGFDAKPATLKLAVSEIVRDTGKANFQLRPNAFVKLDVLQRAVRGRSGQINQVILSAIGGDRSPQRVQDMQNRALRVANRAAPGQRLKIEDLVYRIAGAKAQSVKSAKEQSRLFQSVLTALGSVVALTSMALIANLFVMLGEERRPERGMMRALGLPKSGMLLVGLGEGLVYSLASAGIGVFLGAALGRSIGRALVELYGQILQEFSVDFGVPDFEIQVSTLMSAAAAGFLVSVVAVALVTLRTNRFSVVAAIRGLRDEIAESRRSLLFANLLPAAVGGVLVVVGALGGFLGAAAVQLVGGTLILFGFGGLLRRYTNARFGTTIAALVVMGWGLWGYIFLPDFGEDIDIAFMTITLAAVIVVVAGVVLIAANISVLARVAGLFGSRTRAILRTATAYPVGYRFRTAMSMLMFALVLYMIAAFAIWSGLATGDFETQSGGYDVFATSTAPVANLGVDEAAAVTGMHAARYELGYEVEGLPQVNFPVDLYGVDGALAGSSTFGFTEKPDDLTERQVWEQLANSTDSVVLDEATTPGSVEVGDVLKLNSDKGPLRLRVAGVVDEFWLGGIFVSKPMFGQLYPTRAADTAWLVSAKPGISADVLTRSIEARYPGLGLDARPVKQIFEEAASLQQTFVGLFQVLLKLGLIIGITGLSITAVRNVLERRHAVGVMRAVGFKRYMVGISLLLESVLIATLGCAVGLGTGLAGTYWLTKQELVNLTFKADWPQIFNALTIVYAAVFLFTLIPATRAALLRPAEAVRYVE